MRSFSAPWLIAWCCCPSAPSTVPGKGAIPFPQSAALLRGRAGPSVRAWDAFPAGRGKDCPSALCAVAQTPASAPAGPCQRPRWVPAVRELPPHCWPGARAQGTPASRLRERWLRSLRDGLGIALLALWRDCPSSTGSGGAPRARRKVAEPPHIVAAARGLSGPAAALPSRAGPAGPRPRFRARPRHTRAGPGAARAGGPGAPSGGSGAGAFTRGTRRGGSEAERGAAWLLPWAPG